MELGKVYAHVEKVSITHILERRATYIDDDENSPIACSVLIYDSL
jgi:hypothetical protein